MIAERFRNDRHFFISTCPHIPLQYTHMQTDQKKKSAWDKRTEQRLLHVGGLLSEPRAVPHHH